MKRLISKVTMFLKTQNKINFLLKVEQQAWACMYLSISRKHFNLFQTIKEMSFFHSFIHSICSKCLLNTRHWAGNTKMTKNNLCL